MKERDMWLTNELNQATINDTASQSSSKIINLIDTILLDAKNKQASDIHFEPYENYFRVRMRIDGVLHETSNPPFHLTQQICTRIKILANLDISEKRIPQDGRFKLTLNNQKILDFRVSTCPTIYGEKIAIRLLNSSLTNIAINALGLDDNQLNTLLEHIYKPQGMILVTGPTGSGKTITLYSAIDEINTVDKNILTVEDPVEIYASGINQININLKAGLTFAKALRAFLRQDPDVIMVGEMRDLETAEIAIKAAQTGHLVLSTLHTNSATETLVRLKNMGLPTYNIATSISLIVAQRLARILCPHCKISDKKICSDMQKELEAVSNNSKYDLYTHHQNGCELCHYGYKGRIGLFEIMPVTEEISQAILLGAHSKEMFNLAKKSGIRFLKESGLQKVINGETSLEEISRVIKD